jgi:hypothetical protein
MQCRNRSYRPDYCPIVRWDDADEGVEPALIGRRPGLVKIDGTDQEP